MMQELSYIRCGDYYIPDIRLPKETRPIGRWGRMHRDYIKEHNPIRFNQTNTDCLIFKNGFRLGARMMLEVMGE